MWRCHVMVSKLSECNIYFYPSLLPKPTVLDPGKNLLLASLLLPWTFYCERDKQVLSPLNSSSYTTTENLNYVYALKLLDHCFCKKTLLHLKLGLQSPTWNILLICVMILHQENWKQWIYWCTSFQRTIWIKDDINDPDFVFFDDIYILQQDTDQCFIPLDKVIGCMEKTEITFI